MLEEQLEGKCGQSAGNARVQEVARASGGGDRPRLVGLFRPL